MKRLLLTLLVLALSTVLISSCVLEADVASSNLSKAADQFEVVRRIIFYNGITGEYILTIEGFCSLGNYDPDTELSVTCKVGPGLYKKHFLGLSDNVTYFAEQIDAAGTDPFHYRVIFRPEVILPDIELDTSVGQ